MKRTLPIVVAALVLAACMPVDAKKKKDKEEPPPAQAATASKVVATIGDSTITAEELDQASAGQLMKVRQQEYDIKAGVLEGLIQKSLLEKEAAARGVTAADLLKVEIEDKIAAPTPEEIDAAYERVKSRLGGRTKEQALPDLERQVRAQKANDLRESFLESLATKTGVKVFLDPPRVEVAFPADAPSLGPASAPITIVEYSDYQCPYCRRAHPTIERVMQEYAGKVRFVYRDYPLNFHPRAVPASVAARCAGEQNKFWDYHNHLMTQQGDLSDADLEKRAQAVGLDMAAYASCYGSQRHNEAIMAGFREGQAYGVTGTPAFFVNGRMISGAQPFEAFKTIIDDELSKSAGTN